MNNIRRLMLTLLTSLSLSHNSLIPHGNGGSIAAGVLGGFGAGAILGAVISSRSHHRHEPAYVYREPQYVYNNNDYQSTYFTNWQNELNEREQNLLEKERELNTFERRLSKRSRNITKEQNYKNQYVKASNSKKPLTLIEPNIERKPNQSNRKIRINSNGNTY